MSALTGTTVHFLALSFAGQFGSPGLKCSFWRTLFTPGLTIHNGP